MTLDFSLSLSSSLFTLSHDCLHTDLFSQICFIHKARTIIAGSSQVCLRAERNCLSSLSFYYVASKIIMFCRIVKLELKKYIWETKTEYPSY